MEKQVPPLHRIERCFLCPCGAGVCRLLTSRTPKNPGRNFFKCPHPEQCCYGTNGFFKWEDQVKANEYIDVPFCGGCNAGPCRVTNTTARILFTCTIQPGQGVCPYSVYQDELEMSWMAQVHTIKRPSPLTPANCDDIHNPSPNIGEVKETILTNSLQDDHSPVVSTSLHPKICRTTSRKTKKCKLQEESEETLRSPLKRLRNGSQVPISFVSAQPNTARVVMNSVMVKPQRWMSIAIHQNLGPEFKGWWGRLVFCSLAKMDMPAPEPTVWRFTLLVDPLVMVHGKKQANSDASTMLLSDSVGVQENENLVNDDSLATITISPVSVCNAGPANYVKPLPVDHHVPLHHEPFEKSKFNHAVSDSVSKAFRFAAEQLQNDLFTLLENADSKDHETMKQAAETTFAALDHLHIDYQHLEKRVSEFISRSVSLAAVEQFIVRNDSYQELELQCKFERLKLGEMESAHTKAVDTVMQNRKSLEVLHGAICTAKEWLFEVEAEYLCCELELRDMEAQLENNSAEKRVLEEKYLLASKELEDTTAQLQKQREEAKVAFERAKALLRG